MGGGQRLPSDAGARVSFEEARADREPWGRLVESAVGAQVQSKGYGACSRLCSMRFITFTTKNTLRATIPNSMTVLAKAP